MMKKARLTKWLALQAALLNLPLVHAAPDAGSSVISIGEVRLRAGGKSGLVTAVPGKLYRVRPGGGRSVVADVDVAGTLNAKVKCADGELFEAQSARLLDLPEAPERVACAVKLAFSFTRMFVAEPEIELPGYNLAMPDPKGPVWGRGRRGTGAMPERFGEIDFIDDVAEGEHFAAAKVYMFYSKEFERVIDFKAARTWKDAATLSAAIAIGDKDLDRFVYRDQTRNFAVEWTELGLEALKSRQALMGVSPTGKLDNDTTEAFGKLSGEYINGRWECQGGGEKLGISSQDYYSCRRPPKPEGFDLNKHRYGFSLPSVRLK